MTLTGLSGGVLLFSYFPVTWAVVWFDSAVMMAKGWVAAAAALGLLLAGCSSDDSDTSSDTVASTTPTFEETAPAEVPDIPGKVVVRGETSSCTSATPSAGSVDLLGVDVKLGVAGYAGTAARVTWRLSGPLPTTGTAMLSLMAASTDGEVAEQLGYKVVDGEQVGYFVFANGTQSNLSGYPDTRVAGEVSGVLPSARVDELGPNWHWSAVLNIDGEDVDSCPAST